MLTTEVCRRGGSVACEFEQPGAGRDVVAVVQRGEGVTAVASAAGSAARRQNRPSAQGARVPQQGRGGSADGKTRAADKPVALVPGDGVPATRRPTGSRGRKPAGKPETSGRASTGSANGTSADDQVSVGKGRSRSGAAGAKGRQGKKAASELPGRGKHRDNGSTDVTADPELAAEAGAETDLDLAEAGGLDADPDLADVADLEGDPDLADVAFLDVDAELEDLENIEGDEADADVEGLTAETDTAEAADSSTDAADDGEATDD